MQLSNYLSLLSSRHPLQPTLNCAGYSAKILQPIDISTMRAKINDGRYESLNGLVRDLELMCENAQGKSATTPMI